MLKQTIPAAQSEAETLSFVQPARKKSRAQLALHHLLRADLSQSCKQLLHACRPAVDALPALIVPAGATPEPCAFLHHPDMHALLAPLPEF